MCQYVKQIRNLESCVGIEPTNAVLQTAGLPFTQQDELLCFLYYLVSVIPTGAPKSDDVVFLNRQMIVIRWFLLIQCSVTFRSMIKKKKNILYLVLNLNHDNKYGANDGNRTHISVFQSRYATACLAIKKSVSTILYWLFRSLLKCLSGPSPAHGFYSLTRCYISVSLRFTHLPFHFITLQHYIGKLEPVERIELSFSVYETVVIPLY